MYLLSSCTGDPDDLAFPPNRRFILDFAEVDEEAAQGPLVNQGAAEPPPVSEDDEQLSGRRRVNRVHLLLDCPRDCLVEIFTFVPVSDLFLRLALVCSEFNTTTRNVRICEYAFRSWLRLQVVHRGGGGLLLRPSPTDSGAVFSREACRELFVERGIDFAHKTTTPGDDESRSSCYETFVERTTATRPQLLEPIPFHFLSDPSQMDEKLNVTSQFRHDAPELSTLLLQYANHSGAIQFRFWAVGPLFDFDALVARRAVPILLHKIAAVRACSPDGAFALRHPDLLEEEADPPFVEIPTDESVSDFTLRDFLIDAKNVRRDYVLSMDRDREERFHLELFHQNQPLNGNLATQKNLFCIMSGAVRNPPRVLHPMDFVSQSCHPPYGTQPGIEQFELALNKLMFEDFEECRTRIPDMWLWGSVNLDNGQLWCDSFKWGSEWWGYAVGTYYLPKWGVIVSAFANQTD